MTTRIAVKAMQAAERAPHTIGSRFVAMRDLKVMDAAGRIVEYKRGEILGADFLNAPRVDLHKLLAVRHVREEFIA